MINEILIKRVSKIDIDFIEIDFKSLTSIDSLISEKIIKKIFIFFNGYEASLRSSKIQTCINEFNKSNFKLYNLRSMYIKKVNNSLIFEKKGN